MKLNATQLQRQLAEGLAPVYVISGDDPLLCGENADLVRRACRAAGSEERVVFHIDRSFDWSQVREANSSLSLFAQQRLIELRIPDGKPGDEGAKVLLAWLDNPPPDTTLLVNLPRLDGSTLRTKWAKRLLEHQHSRFLQIWPLDAQQFPEWIRSRLAAVGLHATPDALELLSNRTEGNLLAAVQEIEKLRLFSSNGQVELATVEQAVADSARFDVFKLGDAMLQGNAQHALRILQGLRGEGTEAPVVLWMLGRELRLLYDVAHRMQRGISQSQAFAAQRPPVMEKRKPLLNRALQRHSVSHWARLLKEAQRADEQIKGQASGSAWDTMALILVQAAGVQLALAP